ncbi:hypothetical protein [Bacillus sp. FSL K6-3431]|uniref:hypothetical protein n=1 Tax=Bacillus sp. FSL K6-3431 TaxID=2921500 RepID=UPI0030F4B413
MLKIIEGDFEKLKDEMKSASKSYAKKASTIKAAHKRVHDRPVAVNKMLDRLEDIQKMFKVSRVLPVKIEGVIINFKAYQSFVKKLRKLDAKVSFRDGVLCLEYQTGPKTGGCLEFEDLTIHFQGFQHIPVAEIDRYGG